MIEKSLHELRWTDLVGRWLETENKKWVHELTIIEDGTFIYVDHTESPSKIIRGMLQEERNEDLTLSLHLAEDMSLCIWGLDSDRLGFKVRDVNESSLATRNYRIA